MVDIHTGNVPLSQSVSLNCGYLVTNASETAFISSIVGRLCALCLL